MPRKSSETPLYVKLPSASVDKLDRAAATLGVKKKDLVNDLVTKFVDPQNGVMTGSYSFRAYDPPEIMNVEQAAQFLQLAPGTVIELALAAQLPGRRLGSEWRFSRAALVAWLSTPEQR